MDRVVVQEFTSQGRPYQVRTVTGDHRCSVQVFAGDRPVGPCFSVEREPEAAAEPRWDLTAGLASEVLVDIAKRGVGWRGPAA